MKLISKIAVVLGFMANLQRLVAQGSPDSNFKTGTGADDDVQALAVQADGKIIAAGLFDDINGTANSLGIARLNTNGTVDATFNPGASVDDGINAVAIQSDGKIIIGGGFTEYEGTSRNGISRMNSNGTIDTTFNPGGGVDDLITSVALQSDGKVVIGGYFTIYNGIARSGLARLNANGALDPTFNPGTGVDDAVDSVEVLTNGEILIGGGFTVYNGTSRLGVARINANGTLDVTFNPGSISVNDLVRVAIAQPDGKVIIGGDFTTFNNVSRSCIARLNADGTLDFSFDPGLGADSSVMTLALQPNGKILVGGSFTTMNGVSSPGIARLLPGGGLDTNFHPGAGANGGVLALALQPDGKAVLGGQFTTFGSRSDARLARVLLNDPPSDPLVGKIARSGSNIGLGWTSAKSNIYRVDYKDSLTTPVWTELLPLVTGVGSLTAITNNPAGASQRWYRIAQLPF